MAQSSGLSGWTVLIVEDDFFIAEDEREALEDAGAHVLGPCADRGEALGVLRDVAPDCAVLDLNLGDGPSFDLARLVTARGIPVLFVTGYDASSIPPELAHVPRLQKPVDLRAFVRAVINLREAGSTRA